MIYFNHCCVNGSHDLFYPLSALMTCAQSHDSNTSPFQLNKAIFWISTYGTADLFKDVWKDFGHLDLQKVWVKIQLQCSQQSFVSLFLPLIQILFPCFSSTPLPQSFNILISISILSFHVVKVSVRPTHSSGPQKESCPLSLPQHPLSQ